MDLAAVQCGPGGVRLDWLAAVLAQRRADLVVLPELANTNYFPLESGSHDAAKPATLDGPFVTALRRLARAQRCYILTGVYLEEAGVRSNAAILLGPDGEVVAGRDTRGREHLAYRKVQLCNITTRTSDFHEADYFVEGEHFLVWDTPLGRIGCLICYDRHFPEAWRALRVAGVDVIGVPVASAEGSKPWFLAEMQAMSLQQTVYAAVANRAGTERLSSGVATTFGGLSCIVGPDGEILAVAPFGVPDRVVHGVAEPDILVRTRREHRFFDDLRTDMYAPSPR
jgi:predicted amidohydrolase